jgi:hypothetical protein
MPLWVYYYQIAKEQESSCYGFMLLLMEEVQHGKKHHPSNLPETAPDSSGHSQNRPDSPVSVPENPDSNNPSGYYRRA